MDGDSRPSDYRAIWQRKPVLRAIYTDYYRRILEASVAGRTLEIGGGSGNMKAFADNVVSTDILPAPWLDAVCDAQTLPFRDACFANIVMVDVLHHVARPLCFLREAERVLAPGGRIIAVEPGITPLSGLFYRLFHDEPVDMSADPLDASPPPADKDPYEGNQGLPTRLFGPDRRRLAIAVPGLRIVRSDWLSLVAYPLSGGFRRWSLLPATLAAPLLRAEELLLPLCGFLAAFRLMTVLEKSGES